MHSRTRANAGRPLQRRNRLGRFFSVVILLITAMGPLMVAPAKSALAATPPYTINLTVQEVGGAALGTSPNTSSDFTYLVNEDNTGDPFDPDPNMHPSRHPMASYSPTVAAGNGTGGGAAITLQDVPGTTTDRFLISVRSIGYKLWGQHVRFSQTDAGDPSIKNVTIELIPEPLPLSKLVVQAFHDRAPVNAFLDLPALEPGLAGFNVVIHDVVGEVTVDWFGDPLCGGDCITDADGYVTIENIPFGKYEVQVIPPDNSGWVQTTTLEGTKVIDAWLEENTDGRGAPGEFLIEPAADTAFTFGFIQPMEFANPDPSGGTITGQARNFVSWPPFEQLSFGEPVPYPWVALNDIGNDDSQAYLARGDADGSFVIDNVPPGTYQVVLWDEPLDYIIAFYTVVVTAGETVVPGGNSDGNGSVGVFRWFGWVSGDVFMDNGAGGGTANDGIRNGSESGIQNVDLDIRFRDGSINKATFTDPTGHYEFPEARGPLGRFEVAEVGFGRFVRTGAALHDDHFASQPELFPDSVISAPTEAGGGLLLNQLTWEGKRSIIDWGKRPYNTAAGENGGIAGIVIYATTRNEFNARLAAAEDYEPGLPNATVNLYATVPDPITGEPQVDPLTGEVVRGPQLNTVETDAWEHPNATTSPPGCDVEDQNGLPLTGLTPALIAANCIEVPQVANETQGGAFDGGYAFETMVADPVTGDPIPETPLPPGDYVVEVVPPDFYQVIKEEDQNTDEGDELIPQIPPPPCAGELHLVNDIRNPYDGQMMPLCDRRLVTVQSGQNAASDFFLFTSDAPYVTDDPTSSWTTTESVPPPGRFFGLVEDDIVINANSNSITYGEKRGVPGLPIGVYDYSGRLMLTVYTDENGFYEVLLPSTQSTVCPIPSGVCPGMYVLVVNDPGSAAVPNAGFSGDYLTEPAVRDIWPGKMTPADTPVDPINSLTCSLPLGTPQIFQSSHVHKTTSSGALNITITGTRFGTRVGGVPGPAPTVTLDDDDGIVDPVTLAVVSWTPASPDANPPIFEDVVVVTVPSTLAGSPYQLQVTNNSNGQPGLNGLTFHVRGGAYNPPVVTVLPPTALTGPASRPIQNAIDAGSTAAGALVVVTPGTYHENVILHKRVKLQGHGPGGVVGAPPAREPDPPPEPPDPDDPPTTVPGEEPFAHIAGSVIDGRFYQFDATKRAAWAATLAASGAVAGPAIVPTGAGITVVANPGTEFGVEAPPAGFFKAQIDGLGITASRGEGGGGIYVHAFGRNMLISNNILEGNSSRHGGAISLGRPIAEGGLADNQNDNARIHHNRILSNGGVFFAGAVGIFNGANNYDFTRNDVCGNYSIEYGGGVSHFGLSPGGRIHDNLIYYNDAFDEGGGIMVAGDPAAAPPLGLGSGQVDITHNLIQSNLSNDDGGGIRLLQPLTSRVNIINNMIVNNAATDFGGGIALDNASDAVIVNNTIADNLSTSTAEDADRSGNAACVALHGGTIPPLGSCPHAAGLVSEPHGNGFAPADGSTFSDPVMFNNIFWNNNAYYWGLLPPEPGGDPPMGLALFGLSDLEVFGPFGGPPPGCLDPRFSLLSVAYGPPVAGNCTTTHASNIVGVDPAFVNETFADVAGQPNRFNMAEIQVTLLREEGTLIQFSNFHVPAGSPAVNTGTAAFGGVNAPCDDYDHNGRPNGPAWDIGADEQPGVSGIGACGLGFPATAVLDDFNRAGPALGSNWLGNTATTNYNIFSSTQARVQGAGGYVFWNPTSFGGNQEAFFTFTKEVPSASEQALLLKVVSLSATGTGVGSGTRLIEVYYTETAPGARVIVRTYCGTAVAGCGTQGWQVRATFSGITFNNGDIFGARALSNGIVQIYKNGALVGSTTTATGGPAWPNTSLGGRIGVWFVRSPNFATTNDARFDNFGGGSLP